MKCVTSTINTKKTIFSYPWNIYEYLKEISLGYY